MGHYRVTHPDFFIHGLLSMPNWTQNLTSLLNLFLQSSCPLCQRPTTQEFCQDCTRQLQRCQRQNYCDRSTPELPVFAWGVYGGALKRAIAALKYENQSQIAQSLGYWLAEAWLNTNAAKSLTVVPIPLHADKLHKRGYNQAALLAQSFCQMAGLSLQQHGLERVRDTTAQFELSAKERAKNLTSAFALGSAFRRHAPAKPILILDDIYTTGTTVNSAAQTLRHAGIAVYGVVAIAATQKRSGRAESAGEAGEEL